VLTPAGVACTDTDGNACTAAKCDGAGACDQSVSKVAGTACPDTDGNACTFAECDGAGTCVQNVFAPPGTVCADTDGNQCTQAACTGGTCVQDFFVRNCTLPAVCNPATGSCQ